MADNLDNRTSADDAGWAWFERADAPKPDPTLGDAFARCFRGNDGDKALAYLRALTLERALGPGAADAALRHLEGQRQLVAHILRLVARGRAGQ